jgi:flagellar motor switch protein FliM
MAPQGPLLRPDEVASVLSGERAPRPPEATGSPVYHLRKPVAIAAEDEPAAARRLGALAGCLAAVLGKSLGAEIALEMQGFRQELAGVALDTLPQPACLLAFLGPGGGGFGLAFDPACAIALVEVALGGSGASAEARRTPTLLESRILTSLAAEIAEPLRRASGLKLESGVFGTAGLPAGLAGRGEPLGVGLAKLRIAGRERSALLLAAPALLEAPAPQAAPHASRAVGPLAARLARVQLAIRPVLRAGSVPLAELTTLVPGTILRLDAPEDRPLELRVAGQTVYVGQLARQPAGAVFRAVWRRGRRGPAAGRERT